MRKCQFPAQKLLEVRRTIAQLADETKDRDVVFLCCQMVQDIEQMGLRHLDSGCECWLHAAQARNRAFTINDAAWLLEMKVRL